MRGRVLRFDHARGYGFIGPESGGEDVFLHANDLDGMGYQLKPGTLVEFEAEKGERGLKASSVRVLDRMPVPTRPSNSGLMSEPRSPDDDDVCEVLSVGDFLHELTEALLPVEPSLTGAQILQIRGRLVGFAEKFGWVDG